MSKGIGLVGDDTALRDAMWYERQYNPRIDNPEAAARAVAHWPLWAAHVRETLPHQGDIAYGAHPREIMDFFPAQNPRGCLVFIHGGYWRAFSKNESSWVAAAFVPNGISVLVLNYPLCPEVSLADITASVRRAIAHAWHHVLGEAEKANLGVAGHSAGGYLTAAMFAVPWREEAMPATPFAVGLSVSGIFELAPLVHTSMNTAIGLTDETAARCSLPDVVPGVHAPLLLAVGERESAEFHGQSSVLSRRWAGICTAPHSIATRHHFDVVEELGQDGAPLMRMLLARFDRNRPQVGTPA
jgi:arylformamidase